MSDRWNAPSRWSSAREREERERAREAEREAQRQARLDRAAGRVPEGESRRPRPSERSEARRLSEEERRTIREYRFPAARDSTADRNVDTSSADGPAPATTRQTTTGGTPRTGPIGRRWRSSVEAIDGQPDLAPLPDLPRASGGRSRSSSRLIVFGTALFGLMALVAFLPFSPLGDDDPDPTPTPVGTLPSILDDSTPSGERTVQGAADAPAGPPPDEEQVVCIDPGHGGWDQGWERTDQADPPYSPPYVTEAELNLGMAYMLRDALEAQDITVVMTRMSGGPVNLFEEDINRDGETRRTVDTEDEARRDQAGDRDELQQRINICNEANADILVSLHLNGFDDRSLRGYEILYTDAPYRPFGDQSEALARSIYRELDTAMRNSDYGGGLGRDVKDDTQLESVQHEFGSEEHLVLTGPEINTASYTIRPSQMPGVIIEGVFLSNDQDAQFIVQPENQQMMVEAYARGILEYFEDHPG